MEPEFAPQYSPRERWHRLLLHVALGTLLAAAVYWWALPRFRSFSADAPCELIFGVPGSTVLIYGAIVGAPLAAAVLIVLLTARQSLETIATRRYPPPGRKVYRRVKIKKGWQAIVFALIPAMFVAYLCVLSSQGMSMAARMARETRQSAQCDRNPSPPNAVERGPTKRERR
ncbi:hypothetical protein [Steroidobacter cummioxidans]|uniref:hypothetical protein n=1 Tax=Steroidobacter cummioxidans TaxID=1803913 RepID=UPI00129050F7|nr:hypothetical protein [Steroidobacter cummioxidans]